ncbi:MAG: 23S rRNA (adenine(2503)-C(2))-methyltransferase RlmN [Candidatus Dormibacteria bacterium]
MLPPISSVGPDDLSRFFAAAAQPPYRAEQLRRALWRPEITGFNAIRQFPENLRAALTASFAFDALEVVAQRDADAGETVKLLCRLADGQTIETVAMAYPAEQRRRRATVCVSTQVGCAVGCPFCATGQMGLRRSCTVAEVVDQVRAAARALHARGHGPVTHVVYMGMGEPLAAYDTTVGSLRILAGQAGISPRRITVSTSGVVPGIDRLADEGPPVTLAISLHAATDALRDRLVPLNRAHPLDRLVAAGMRYAERTGRRVSYEWCLIAGENDGDEQAQALRRLAYGAHAHVNVIPMNHVDGSPWGPPDAAVTRRFLAQLRGVRHTLRDTRGADSEAACGQLRAGLERRRFVQADGTLSRPRRAAVATG